MDDKAEIYNINNELNPIVGLVPQTYLGRRSPELLRVDPVHREDGLLHEIPGQCIHL